MRPAPRQMVLKGRNLGFPAGQTGRVPCRQGNVAQLLLDVSLVKALGELVGPVRRLVALNLLLGRSLWTLISDLLYKLTDVVGWLSAPPRNPLLRSVGQGVFSVRRWHYTLGACPAPLSPVLSDVSPRSRWSDVPPALLAAGLLLVTAARRLLQRAREVKDEVFQARKRLQLQMEQADSYEEWSLAATKLDQMAMEGLSPEERKAKVEREGRLYDRKLVLERLGHLRRVRQGGKIQEMMFAVRMDLLRNLGNMTNRWEHPAGADCAPGIFPPVQEAAM